MRENGGDFVRFIHKMLCPEVISRKLLTKRGDFAIINMLDRSAIKKQILIKKILKENDCFLKMSIENAYSILRDLKISEENLKKVYMELV